jgi:hypothetical protein
MICLNCDYEVYSRGEAPRCCPYHKHTNMVRIAAAIERGWYPFKNKLDPDAQKPSEVIIPTSIEGSTGVTEGDDDCCPGCDVFGQDSPPVVMLESPLDALRKFLNG